MKKSAFFAVFFLLAASVTFAWAAEAEVPENADAAVVSDPAAEPIENAEAQEPVKKSFWEKAGDWKKAAVEKAGEVKETIAEKAGEAKETVTEKVGEVKAATEEVGELKETAVQKAGELKEAAVQKAGELKEAAVQKTGEVKEAVVQKTGEVKEAVVQKTGEVKEAVVQKTGEVKEAVVQKAGELKEKVVEKTKQLRGKYKSPKDWFQRKKEEYQSVESWKEAKKEHWNDFRERKYLDQPHPAMVVYSWVFVSVSAASLLFLGLGFLVGLKRGRDSSYFKLLLKQIVFFIFICFVLSVAAFYYVCTCETDFSWLICVTGAAVFWILYGMLAHDGEVNSVGLNFMEGFFRIITDWSVQSLGSGTNPLDGCTASCTVMALGLFLAFMFSILVMHIVWLIYVLGSIGFFFKNCFGRFPQVGRDEIALQEGIEEKP